MAFLTTKESSQSHVRHAPAEFLVHSLYRATERVFDKANESRYSVGLQIFSVFELHVENVLIVVGFAVNGCRRPVGLIRDSVALCDHR